MDKELLFALDIGTRSVVGLVGELTSQGINLLAAERQEHYTRAMLDGQIHDVTEVANVLATVKNRLEETFGPLTKVAVAAAGRALHTIRVSTDLDTTGRGALTATDERTLELAALQAAQQQLAGSTLANAAGYYCVGYSVVAFSLDGTGIKSLVGQRGKLAAIEIIATFLPRQVIDSLQSAIDAVGLTVATLTLEPIAAINALIPPTMRHLNLALVDVGAGTSDVAITRAGTVSGYGMVPCAGDEITEALSQQYLLDFNVAETIKRQLGGGKNKKISYNDVLGTTHKASANEMIKAITPTVNDLAQLIAAQILNLNNAPPQAVLLVGGGALTPLLPVALGQALDIPASRVAVRCPDAIEGIANIPSTLQAPDAVTPLGILKLAGGQTLHFVNVNVNGQMLRLFNLGRLTVADALLAAGIDVKSLHGRPGLGLTLRVNDATKFIAGSHGQPGAILMHGEQVKFDHPLADGDELTVTKGQDGLTPQPRLANIVTLPAPLKVIINNQAYDLKPRLRVNGQTTSEETILHDRDDVTCHLPKTIGEVLDFAGLIAQPNHYVYTINNVERTFSLWPEFKLNNTTVTTTSPVRPNDKIDIITPPPPSLRSILGLSATDSDYITVYFDGAPCQVPTRRVTLQVNGKHTQSDATVPPGSIIEYTCSESPPTVSDVLLAANFNPCALTGISSIDIKLNGIITECMSPVKNGDKVEIIAY